jgi:two-component system, chemotaxis family, sensor kinase CheA
MAPDPYKYFRVEARELLDGLTEGVLELEKGRAERERVTSMLRLAHTLKGAARVVKQPAMAELAHGMEDLLSPYRDDERTVSKEQAREMLQMLDQIGSGLAALDAPPDRSVRVAARPAQEEPLETVRVEVEEVEILLGRLSEAGAELASIENEMEALQRARRMANVLVEQLQSRGEVRNGSVTGRVRTLSGQLLESLQLVDRRLGESVERIAREFDQARELVNRMRLLRSAAIFPPLTRVARDAAVMLGKQVEFAPAGGDIRLDAQVLTILRDALVQLVRNAVAHGIESAERRASAGKPPCGRVELRIERRGNGVAFLCRDDGGGFDLGAIRRVAIQKRVISPAHAEGLGLQDAMDLLLRGGLSTTGQVDEISGRGIGLDIVRAAVTRLKGEISVETFPGRGTTVEICVPASLTSVLALTVASDGVVASLPLDCVRQTLRVEGPEIARCGVHESISYQGRPIPFLRLSCALGMEESTFTPRERCSTVVVGSGPDLAAIGVDRLMGTGTVLVRALPALAPAARVVNGATLDNEGNPQVFLDPAGLVEAASQGHRRLLAPAAASAPVLVIDDSLTTRMVEQGILESAGYQVELATSGEEALEKALARPYSLFLVDVEMPGIDGFEFVSRTRADPVLRDVPAILVTSRASSEDRRRGEESGARAYIVKGEFEQNHFLKTIQQLVR